MKLREPSSSARAFAMIYSPTGVGKTCTTLMTAPRPILYYEAEPRPMERAAQGVVDLTSGIQIGHPESFEDLKNHLEDNYEKIIKKYKSVVIDSFSFLMNVTLLGEIEEETGKAEVFDGKKRPLVNMGRTDQTGYGALASLMKRLCAILGMIASEGLLVVCTALEADTPKWNRELTAAPALAGREFPRDMPGYFDLIGRVETRVEDGKVIYPPRVHFRSEDGDFLAKWSGPELKGPPYGRVLDWEKILQLKKKKGEE